MNLNIRRWRWEQLLAACFAFGIATLAYADDTKRDTIQLLAPFGSSDTVQICDDAISTWLGYWGPAVAWSFRVGMALCTLWLLIASVSVVTSGSNAGRRGTAMSMAKNAVFGLILFVFAGSVLRFLNNIYFVGGDVSGGSC